MKAKTLKHAFLKRRNHFRNKTYTGLRKFGGKATKKAATSGVNTKKKIKVGSPVKVGTSPTKKVKLNTNDVLINEKFKEIAGTVEQTHVLLLKYDVNVISARDEQLKTLKALLLNKVSYVNVWKNMKENSLLSEILSEKQQAVDPRAVMMDQCIWIGNASAKIPASNVVSFCVPNEDCVHTVCFSLDDLTGHIKKYKKDEVIPNIWAEEIKTKIPKEFHKHVNPVMNPEWVDYINTHQRISNINDITKKLHSGDMVIFNWLSKMLVKFTQINPETLLVGTFITNLHSYVPSFVANSTFFKFSTNVLEKIYKHPSWMFILLVITKAARLFMCMFIEGLDEAKRTELKMHLFAVFTGKPIIKDILNIGFAVYNCMSLSLKECVQSIKASTLSSFGSIYSIVKKFAVFCVENFIPYSKQIIDMATSLWDAAKKFFAPNQVVSILAENTFIEYLSAQSDWYLAEFVAWTFLYHLPSESFNGLIVIVGMFCPAQMGMSLLFLKMTYTHHLQQQQMKNPDKKYYTIGDIIRSIMRELAIFKTLYQIVVEIKDWILMLVCFFMKKIKSFKSAIKGGKLDSPKSLTKSQRHARDTRILRNRVKHMPQINEDLKTKTELATKNLEQAIQINNEEKLREANAELEKAKARQEEVRRHNEENEIALRKITAEAAAAAAKQAEEAETTRLNDAERDRQNAIREAAIAQSLKDEAQSELEQKQREKQEADERAIAAEENARQIALEARAAQELGAANAVKLAEEARRAEADAIQQNLNLQDAKNAVIDAKEEVVKATEYIEDVKKEVTTTTLAVETTQVKLIEAHDNATEAVKEQQVATEIFKDKNKKRLEEGYIRRQKEAEMEAEQKAVEKKEDEIRLQKEKDKDPAAIKEKERREAEKKQQENDQIAKEKSKYCCYENALYEFINLKPLT